MDTADFTVNQLVDIYVKIRGAINKTEEDHKKVIDDLHAQLQAITDKLLDVCKAHEIDTIRTPSGTLTRKVTSRYWTSDWDSMYQFIKKHDAPFLLEQRIHNSNMRQFLQDHPDEAPAGLNSDSKYTISVRKPTAK
jgi:hypothetical protein